MSSTDLPKAHAPVGKPPSPASVTATAPVQPQTTPQVAIIQPPPKTISPSPAATVPGPLMSGPPSVSQLQATAPPQNVSRAPNSPAVQPPRGSPASIPPASRPPVTHQPGVPALQPPSAEAMAELYSKQRANITVLDDLAGRILSLLGEMTTTHAMALSSDLELLRNGGQPYSPGPAGYRRLKEQFDPIRSLYAAPSRFILADNLGLNEPEQLAALRKANEAIFCSAVFAGSHITGIGQQDMDQGFLHVFVDRGGVLSKRQAEIWIEFKTQTFLSAIKVAPPEHLMRDLFPGHIANMLLARRPGSTGLQATEEEFLRNFEKRKILLQNHIDRKTVAELHELYTYPDFGELVTGYLREVHCKPLVDGAEFDKDMQEFMNGILTLLEDPEFRKAPMGVDMPLTEFLVWVNDAYNEAMLTVGPNKKDLPEDFLRKVEEIMAADANDIKKEEQDNQTAIANTPAAHGSPPPPV